jgi:hypothetical protein
MTRREFFLLLSRSGLLVAGGGALGPLGAWAQVPGTAHAPQVLTPEIPTSVSDVKGFAVNPIRPYLAEHPFPWPAPTGGPGPQSFDLVSWLNGHNKGGVAIHGLEGAINELDGTISFDVQAAPGQVVYTVRRNIAEDELVTTYTCSDDPWHTPRSWNVAQHPTALRPGIPLVSSVQGSFQDGKIVLGRLPDVSTSQPLTTLAALVRSIPVLEHAASSGAPFHALSESGVLFGPLQARVQDPLLGDDGTPLLKVVVLWGGRMMPTHLLYDSYGMVAQTGFLMSFIRQDIS